MKRVKKITIGLVAGVCSVLVLFTAVALIAPWLIEKTSLANKVRSKVSALVGGDFDYSRLHLSVFPSPHIVLVNPQIDIPKQLSASAENIEVYPEIITSLTGRRIVLKKAAVMRPKVTIWMPESTDRPQQHSRHVDISEVLPSLLKGFAKLPKILLSVDNGTISQGSVKLIYDQTSTFSFDSLDALIQNVSDSVTLRVTATSNMFENVSVTGTIDTSQSKGSAQVELGRLKLGAIYNIFLPDASLRIENGEADIDLGITLHDKENIALHFNCSAPNVRLLEAGQTTDIEVQTLSGSVNVNPASTTIAISKLLLGSPLMRISGSVKVSEEAPKLNLKLEGRNIDINSTRSVSLALSGSSSITQTIFDILKGGAIPLLTVSGQADTPSGLADLDNLVLQANLSNGNIVIPGADLVLTDVSGDVDMSKGILTGENVLAQWQNSTVKNGKFKIDLTKDPLPLHVEAGIDIDVADIPAILANFIKDQAFNNELALIKDLRGSATGALSLTGDTDQVNVDVSATDIKLSTRYHKIPYPLKVTDGGISYDGHKIQWERLNGSVGTSSFASFSGNLDLGKTKNFTIASGTSRIVIPDLMPWISSNKATRNIAEYYGGGNSILQLTEIQANGPLQDFRQSHFNLTGEFEDLTIQHLSRQPGPLKIVSLKFNADTEALNFSDVQVSMLDGSLTMSGKYLDYMADNKRDISLSFDGRMGPQLIGWVTDNVHSPPWLKLRPLSIRKSHLTYSYQGKHKISATLALQDNLAVITDVSLAKDAVIVDSLMVKDHLTKVSVTAKKMNQLLDVTFDGTLHESTLSQVAQITPQLRGSIDGKAKITLNLENPFDFSLLGEMNGEGLSVPITSKAPLIINNIEVKGVPDTITLKSANLSWSGTVLTLAGSVRPNASGALKVALDVEADRLDVDAIKENIRSQSTSQDKKTAPKTFSLPIEGEVHFKTNKLEAYGYAIQPLQADIRLQNNAADITLKDMVLCGIPVVGTINISQQNFAFHLEPEAHAQKLSTTLNCFVDQQFKADGILDLVGVLEGHGTAKDLAMSTTGYVKMSISDGHLYHDIILLNILKFLNVTQVLAGQVSADEMMEEGVGFDRLQAHVKLQEGELEVKKIILDANEIKLSGTGKMNILSKQIDFTILAAPLAGENILLGHIPLIGGALQTITTIPLSLTGKIDDIKVIPLKPSAVGFSLQEIMRQVSGIPVKLVHLDDYHGAAKSDDK